MKIKTILLLPVLLSVSIASLFAQGSTTSAANAIEIRWRNATNNGYRANYYLAPDLANPRNFLIGYDEGSDHPEQFFAGAGLTFGAYELKVDFGVVASLSYVDAALSDLFLSVATTTTTKLIASNGETLQTFTGTTPEAWTLPPIASTPVGKIFYFLNKGTAEVDILCSGSDEIYQAAFGTLSTTVLYPTAFYFFISDGTHWVMGYLW